MIRECVLWCNETPAAVSVSLVGCIIDVPVSPPSSRHHRHIVCLLSFTFAQCVSIQCYVVL